ncbi:hypothetical protein O6H91_08G037800 [Diphasiastrum complanatum]|uniref:Uncharacterized protein n=1 Tax=Diphasiastrum complanatum TaxID=34168 RepID=A0ACC2CWK1_DIPCM|nr:hypothetical protein O6H91_08G037800 [Diphasiastrum complanatum]
MAMAMAAVDLHLSAVRPFLSISSSSSSSSSWTSSSACGMKTLQFSTRFGPSRIDKEQNLQRNSIGQFLRSSNAKAKGKIMMNAEFPVDSDSYGYIPQAEFYKVEAILRPWRLPHVASALLKSGIRGVTVSDVRGFGAQGGSRERQAGSEFTEDSFVTKVKLEIVVSKDQVEVVIETIIDQARTGEIGDGKIFVVPVADVIRIRTGERGLKAERMAGGRTELLSNMN